MSRNKNALAKLGCALTGFFKSSQPQQSKPARQIRKNNLPVPRRNNRPHSRRSHTYYSDHSAIQSSNRVRTQIINPDGSCMSVDRSSYNAACRKINYRRNRY